MSEILLPVSPETVMPRRIQRKRTKGWRMPEGAIYVGRPTIWGNPFRIGWCDRTAAEVVALYRQLLTEPSSLRRHKLLRFVPGNDGRGEGRIAEIRERLPELRGKDLCCWCPLISDGVYVPCHANVLLELANAPAPGLDPPWQIRVTVDG